MLIEEAFVCVLYGYIVHHKHPNIFCERHGLVRFKKIRQLNNIINDRLTVLTVIKNAINQMEYGYD